ncbi:hypothetical protein [Halovenus salina]|uniref:DUF7982 domain-containing protein n=1 Tax=Halovenus salina TaxID=1510225 RepID=A0ABD5W3M4_9EURY
MTADESEPMDVSTVTPDSDEAAGTNQGERAQKSLDLAAQLELVEEENRRLRTEYARARQSKYRRTAYGLFVVGLFTVLLGVLFPGVRRSCSHSGRPGCLAACSRCI